MRWRQLFDAWGLRRSADSIARVLALSREARAQALEHARVFARLPMTNVSSRRSTFALGGGKVGRANGIDPRTGRECPLCDVIWAEVRFWDEAAGVMAVLFASHLGLQSARDSSPKRYLNIDGERARSRMSWPRALHV